MDHTARLPFNDGEAVRQNAHQHAQQTERLRGGRKRLVGNGEYFTGGLFGINHVQSGADFARSHGGVFRGVAMAASVTEHSSQRLVVHQNGRRALVGAIVHEVNLNAIFCF